MDDDVVFGDGPGEVDGGDFAEFVVVCSDDVCVFLGLEAEDAAATVCAEGGEVDVDHVIGDVWGEADVVFGHFGWFAYFETSSFEDVNYLGGGPFLKRDWGGGGCWDGGVCGWDGGGGDDDGLEDGDGFFDDDGGWDLDGDFFGDFDGLGGWGGAGAEDGGEDGDGDYGVVDVFGVHLFFLPCFLFGLGYAGV